MAGDIAARASAYFQQQISAFETMISEMESMGEVGEDLETFVRMQDRHEQMTSSLVAEYNAIRREWTAAQANEVTQARAKISEIAERAQDAARRLDAAQRKLIKKVEARKTQLQDEMHGLGRERGLLRKFQPQSLGEPGFIDKRM